MIRRICDTPRVKISCLFFNMVFSLFQAEDGIRDVAVTGVQTCALPISRPISCRTDPSRWAVPGFPWKYLLVTMFVAVCDQLFGTSTSSWRKIVTPFSFPISAVRFSHSTASKGDFFPSVKYRWKLRPFPAPRAGFSAAVSVAGEFPLNACFTVAIRPSALWGPHSRGVNPLILLLCVPQRYGASLQGLV